MENPKESLKNPCTISKEAQGSQRIPEWRLDDSRQKRERGKGFLRISRQEGNRRNHAGESKESFKDPYEASKNNPS